MSTPPGHVAAQLVDREHLRRPSLSLRVQLLVSFLVPVLLVVALGMLLLFRMARNALEEELGRSLSSQAAVIGASLKADRVVSLTEDEVGPQPSRSAKALFNQLEEAKKSAGLRRVFVFDAQKHVRLDTERQLPFGSEMAELFRDEFELKRVFQGLPTASQVLFEDQTHTFYKTGYAPLWSGDQVVGAVGVEGSAAFFGPLAQVRNGFLLLTLTTAVLLLLAVAWSTRVLTAPIARLVDSATRMAGGDLLTPVQLAGNRELAILSAAFEQTRRSLEQREREQKMMLGGVAHEIKNPLGGIELFSGLLHEELTAPRVDATLAQSHLQKIDRELGRLKQLVEDFLKYAREQALEVTSFQSTDLIRNAVSRVFVEPQSASSLVELRVEPQLLHGDESQLTTALLNVIKNAQQANGLNQKVLVSGTSGGNVYRIEVTDNGPGIPLDKQRLVFDLFYTTKQQGTGLGLALTKKFVEAHKGTVSFSSTPGKTVFVMTIPA